MLNAESYSHAVSSFVSSLRLRLTDTILMSHMACSCTVAARISPEVVYKSGTAIICNAQLNGVLEGRTLMAGINDDGGAMVGVTGA